MTHPTYGITRELPGVEPADALVRTKQALAAQGFGVLAEIDVSATLKAKLGVDTRPYVILGACNPPLAHRAMQAEPFLGLFLPCNVVVMGRDEGGSVVSAIRPREQFKALTDPPAELAAVADEVEGRLRTVIESV